MKIRFYKLPKKADWSKKDNWPEWVPHQEYLKKLAAIEMFNSEINKLL